MFQINNYLKKLIHNACKEIMEAYNIELALKDTTGRFDPGVRILHKIL